MCPGDIVEVHNDCGSSYAMAYLVPESKANLRRVSKAEYQSTVSFKSRRYKA